MGKINGLIAKVLSYIAIVSIVEALTVLLSLANVRYYDSFQRVTSLYIAIPLIPYNGFNLYLSIMVMLLPLISLAILLRASHVYVVLVPLLLFNVVLASVNPYIAILVSAFATLTSIVLIVLHNLRIIYYLLEACVLYELVMLVYWITYIIGFKHYYTFIVGSMQLWSIAAITITPLLAYIIVYSWIIRPVIKLYVKLMCKALATLGCNVELPSKTSRIVFLDNLSNKLNLSNKFVRLGIVFALTLLLIVLPRTIIVNPYGYTIGVDSFRVRNLFVNNNYDLGSILSNWKWGWDRLLTMLLLYVTHAMLGINPLVLNEILISILLLALPLVVYILALKSFGDENIAFWAALLTSLGHQMAPIVYGGYSANALALLLSYLGIALMLSKKKSSIFVGVLMVVLAFMSHMYLGLQVILGLTIYYSIRVLGKLKNKVGLAKLAGLIGGIMVLITSIVLWFNSIANELLYKKRFFGKLTPLVVMVVNSVRRTLSSMGKLYYSSVTGYTFYLWGTYNNPLLYLLATIGLFSINTINLVDIFLLGAMPYVLFDRVIKTRFILNIPLQLYAAKVIAYSDARVKAFIVIAQLVLMLKYMINAVPLTFTG